MLAACAAVPAMAELPTKRPAAWHLPTFKSADGKVTAQLGGRLHLDLVKFDDDGRGRPNASGWQVRRGWVNLIGKLYGFDYRVSVDYADHMRSYKSVYLRHRLGPGVLTVGQFKPYFSLDDTISSDDIVMMDRAFVATQLAPLFRLGAAYLGNAGDVTYGLALYSLNDLDKVRPNGEGQALRLTWAPLHEEGRVLHLGLSLAHERYARSSNAALPPGMAVRPAGAKSDRSRLRLFRIQDGEAVAADKHAFELGTVTGSWSFQGEYGGARYDDDIQRALVRSWYGQVSYFLTGQARPYSRGTGRFDSVEAPGAWELAVRYDHIDARQRRIGQPDLSDRGVDAWTLGLNWYANPNLRLMFDYIDSRNRDRLLARTLDHTRALIGRLQFVF